MCKSIIRKRWVRVSLGVVALFVALGISINLWILQKSYHFIVTQPDRAPQAETIIILGAKVYANGRLSPMLQDRVDTALDLFHQGKGDTILVSGDHGQVGYDEVNTIKDYLLKQGVDGEKIFLDHAGFDTYDSLYRAQAIFQMKSAVVVTQRFHLPRAVYIGRALGLDVTGVVADRQVYLGVVYNYLREIIARIKSFLRVVFHSQPVYLGEPIPITGSSFASWDEPYPQP